MAQKLGPLEKVELRKIWSKEPVFSKWFSLEDNLCKLGDVIGVDMVLEETEASVGAFNVDILAHEDGGNRRIIIENQFGRTDHDHLGKLNIYASGQCRPDSGLDSGRRKGTVVFSSIALISKN